MNPDVVSKKLDHKTFLDTLEIPITFSATKGSYSEEASDELAWPRNRRTNRQIRALP
ncbi:MAG: hypothetical protein JWN25_1116 [Verrucomicrobiales bacterium]|nr:hypothetical protein [Verrucomicrobiales bacterium]